MANRNAVVIAPGSKKGTVRVHNPEDCFGAANGYSAVIVYDNGREYDAHEAWRMIKDAPFDEETRAGLKKSLRDLAGMDSDWRD